MNTFLLLLSALINAKFITPALMGRAYIICLCLMMRMTILSPTLSAFTPKTII